MQMASDISPGHFMLPLPINKDVNIDKAEVETKLRDLGHFRLARVDRPEELAILNLQGLLTIRLRRYEEALGYFREVLGKDPHNLNALANLEYVLEKLFRLVEAEDYKDQWVGLIRSEGPVLPKKHCLYGRCLAEHAYAHSFDIHSDTIGGERYKKSNELYYKALECIGEDIDIAENDGWKFNMAFNAHKLFDCLWFENKATEATDYIDNALNWFFGITQRNPGDPEIQWDSWRNLADIFRKMKTRKIKGEVPSELKAFQSDPEKCMLKAMEITPNNARLLARYANFLFFLKRESLQKPLELLEQSIRLDSSEFNFYALTTRAMINLKFYKSRLKESQPKAQTQDSSELALLRNILQVVKSDLEKAMSMHVTPWDLTHLGEVYYLLAKHHSQQDNEVRSLIVKALLHLTKASDCQDGYKRQEVHTVRGRCLFDIGEKRSAIGCFKQAIDCESPTSTYTGNFNELFGVYLDILQNETLEEDPSIIAEAAFSLKKALLKYSKYTMDKFCIINVRQQYSKELQLIAIYCRKYKEYGELVSLLESGGSTPRPVPTTSALRKDNALQQSWARTRHTPSTRSLKQGEGSAASASAAAASDGGLQHDPTVGTDFEVDEGSAEEVKEEVEAVTESLEEMSLQDKSPVPKQPIRNAPEKSRVQQFENDFCVIYPESEKGWVSYDLLPELETIHKLKGFIRDRDALPGTMKNNSDIDMMKSSASILLVVNKDFKQECEFLMNYALELRKEREKGKYIIVIIRDNSEVPYEITIFNSFEAIGPVDWNKLANAIEQQM